MTVVFGKKIPMKCHELEFGDYLEAKAAAGRRPTIRA
jgi:hypothetical protein